MLSKLGDLSRFEHPRQLMTWLGVTPFEHSSGERRCQGSITKTGNSYACKLLVEAAWSYRFPALMSADVQRLQEGIPKPIIDRAWDAQLRLCRRYRKFAERGKNANIAVVAVARELAGFIWEIGRLSMPHQLLLNECPSADGVNQPSWCHASLLVDDDPAIGSSSLPTVGASSEVMLRKTQ